METINFSKNQKLNKVLNEIYIYLIEIGNTEEESITEIARYKRSFPKEKDYNIYQHGLLLAYEYDIRQLYEDYNSLKKVSYEKILEIYMSQIRYVANYILDQN